jgi:Uma2 family endonuclease
MNAAKKLNQFLEFDDNLRAEFIDGQVVHKALPGGAHAIVEGAILRNISSVFHKKKKENGTGGWWILPEVSIRYYKLERILTADLAGWRRDEVPSCPKSYPVNDKPNWVCEVSHTTLKKDFTTVFETLQQEGVSFYWIANVENGQLQVFELIAGKYALIQSLFKDDGLQIIKPFENIEFNLGVLFGDDED